MARYWCEYYLFTYIQKLVSKSLLYTVTTVRRLVLCPPKNYFVSFICKAKPLLIKFQLWRFKDCSTRRFRRNKKVKKVGRVGRRIQVCNWSNATGFVLTLGLSMKSKMRDLFMYWMLCYGPMWNFLKEMALHSMNWKWLQQNPDTWISYFNLWFSNYDNVLLYIIKTINSLYGAIHK